MTARKPAPRTNNPAPSKTPTRKPLEAIERAIKSERRASAKGAKNV